MKRRGGLARIQAIEGFLFILPGLLGLALFVAYPFIQSLWFALNEVKLAGSGLRITFIGLQNFKDAFLVDVKFIPFLIEVTSKLLVQLPVVITFSLILALLLNQKLPGTGLFRAMYFLPVVFASGAVLQELMQQGAANLPILDSSNLYDLLSVWLTPEFADAVMRLIGEVVRSLWGSGVQIVIFLAGLQSIPPALYEAGQVDGATSWEMFWKITLPTLSPIILLNVIYTIVDGFTDVFNPILGYIRSVAFAGQFKLGYAAALGWIYFVFIFLILMLTLRISRRHVFYAGSR